MANSMAATMDGHVENRGCGSRRNGDEEEEAPPDYEGGRTEAGARHGF
jgi:hypothetical protein